MRLLLKLLAFSLFMIIGMVSTGASQCHLCQAFSRAMWLLDSTNPAWQHAAPSSVHNCHEWQPKRGTRIDSPPRLDTRAVCPLSLVRASRNHPQQMRVIGSFSRNGDSGSPKTSSSNSEAAAGGTYPESPPITIASCWRRRRPLKRWGIRRISRILADWQWIWAHLNPA